MNRFFNLTAKLIGVLAIAFIVAACGQSQYKTQRNLVIDVAASHEENLAVAEKIVSEIDVAALRAAIRESFPDVTAEHLESFTVKAKVMKIGETNNAMIESGLSFTDTDIPANEIMDFVHKNIQAEVQAVR
ncbi:MAG: hypothetical protein NXI24_07410 [bacterium]|nr:hypothetical protein [bacterium]